MANPTYPSSEAKLVAKAKLDAASAKLKSARALVAAAKAEHTEAATQYHVAKATASLERRAHFNSVQERRIQRVRKLAEPTVRKPYDTTNRSPK